MKTALKTTLLTPFCRLRMLQHWLTILYLSCLTCNTAWKHAFQKIPLHTAVYCVFHSVYHSVWVDNYWEIVLIEVASCRTAFIFWFDAFLGDYNLALCFLSLTAFPTCEPLTQFSCSNGRCISVKWHCDSGKCQQGPLGSLIEKIVFFFFPHWLSCQSSRLCEEAKHKISWEPKTDIS